MDEALKAEAARAAQELGITDDQPQQPTATPEPEAPETPVATEPAPQPVEAPQSQDAPATPEEPQTPVVQSEEEDEDYYPSVPSYQYQPPVQQPEQPAPTQPEPSAQQVQPSQQVPQLDPSQFTDQYGNVDMAKFTLAMRQRDEALAGQITSNLNTQLLGNFNQLAAQAVQQARQEAIQQVQQTETEKRAWDRTFAKYPQVRENKDLRDQIHKMRLGEIAVTGKPVSPVKMADRYYSQIAAAREDGVKQATQTVKVQATAHLETADNTASDKGLKAQQNWDRVGDRNRRTAESARQDILKQWMSDGTLKV